MLCVQSDKTALCPDIVHPYVFELLLIIYAHANIIITSSDEGAGSVLLQGLCPGHGIYSNF